MKKIAVIFGILSVSFVLFLSSCNSSKATLCPAYPPSSYRGDIQLENGIQIQPKISVDYAIMKRY